MPNFGGLLFDTRSIQGRANDKRHRLLFKGYDAGKHRHMLRPEKATLEAQPAGSGVIARL